MASSYPLVAAIARGCLFWLSRGYGCWTGWRAPRARSRGRTGGWAREVGTEVREVLGQQKLLRQRCPGWPMPPHSGAF